MLSTRDRLLFGLLYPVLILIPGLMLIMSLPAGAAAAEFAALGVLLGAVIAAPILLLVNITLAWNSRGSKQNCFIRGMVLPAMMLTAALAYQLGLLDALL